MTTTPRVGTFDRVLAIDLLGRLTKWRECACEAAIVTVEDVEEVIIPALFGMLRATDSQGPAGAEWMHTIGAGALDEEFDR